MAADARATREALDRVRDATSLLSAIEGFDGVRAAARADGPAAGQVLAAAIHDPRDALVALAAVHGAGQAGAGVAADQMVPLLHGTAAHLREHAAWALASAAPVDAAVEPLQALVDAGGFPGALAAATLERWAEPAPAGAPTRRAHPLLTAQPLLTAIPPAPTSRPHPA